MSAEDHSPAECWLAAAHPRPIMSGNSRDAQGVDGPFPVRLARTPILRRARAAVDRLKLEETTCVTRRSIEVSRVLDARG